MNLDEEIPFKVCIQQPSREDRRRQASEMFRMHGLKVLRRPGPDAARSRFARGFEYVRQRALYLTALLAIREARQRKAGAVLIFEDDVVLHEDFRQRAGGLELPQDWGLLYFGCLHLSRPQRVAPNLVRVARAVDNHALAVRANCFDLLLEKLLPRRLPGGRAHSGPFDLLLSELHGIIPAYAAWPNLAWQRAGHSDMSNHLVSNYFPDGKQRFMEDVVKDLE